LREEGKAMGISDGTGSARRNFVFALVPFVIGAMAFGIVAGASEINRGLVALFFVAYLVGGLPGVLILAVADQEAKPPRTRRKSPSS
jgi:hypothetical protein